MYLSLLLKTFCIYLAQHLFTMIPTPELCVKGVLQKVWYVRSFLCVKYAERVCLVSVSPTKSIFSSTVSIVTFKAAEKEVYSPGANFRSDRESPVGGTRWC